MTLVCEQCGRLFTPSGEGQVCLVCGALVCGHCAGEDDLCRVCRQEAADGCEEQEKILIR